MNILSRLANSSHSPTALHSRRKVLFAAVVLTSLAIGFGDVAADEPDAKTRAQTLFLEGRNAIDTGDWAAGCPKVRTSLELFSVANSHFTVAQCDERDGHIVAALEHWERGLALVDASDPRAKVAKERMADLETRVPRIRVVVPPANASATVWLDDVQLDPALFAAPLRVEPGKHVFVVRATGRQDKRKEIDIAEKERTEFVVNVGEPETPQPMPTTSSSARPVGGTPPSMHPRKTAGFVVGGIGVASLLASAGTAYGVYSVKQNIVDSCILAQACKSKERDELVTQYKSLLVANAFTFGLGLAGIGAGVLMVVTAPKKTLEKPPNAQLVPLAVPGGAGIGLSGRF